MFLRCINLCNSGAGAPGVEQLCDVLCMGRHRCLTTLILARNPLTSVMGPVLLRTLAVAPALTEVDVSNTTVRAAAPAPL